MKKRHYLYMIIGIAFAVVILPGVLMWLEYPTPSQAIANMFTAILGESNFVNNLIAFSIVGVFIALIIVGVSKTKKMEKSS